MNDKSDNESTADPVPMYEARHSADLERLDRENPIPGGEPPCPLCEGKISRLVEAHPSPHTGSSPFRVRLVCTNQNCRRWTVYAW
jgi:hypothetical protein